MFGEDDYTEEEKEEIKFKMMSIYSDPVFKNRLVNKDNPSQELFSNEILELKEDMNPNGKNKKDKNYDKKFKEKNQSLNLNKKTKRD